MTLLLSAASTIGVYITLAVALLVFIGVGACVELPNSQVSTRRDWFVEFWIGLAATIWFLILWNFWFPVNTVAFVIVILVGGAGVYRSRVALCRVLRAARRAPRREIVAVVLVGLWLANLATAPLTNWDSELYHLRSMRWAQSYPAIPGLANLYGPLGLNSANSLYGALHAAGPWGPYAHHVVSSSLLFPLLLRVTQALLAFLESGKVTLSMFLLAPVVHLMRAEQVSSLTTDLATTVTLLATMIMWHEWISGGENGSRRERARVLLAMTAVLALATCMKFSSVVFAASIWALIAIFWLKTASLIQPAIRTLAWSVTIAGGMGLSWMARGIVLSGYPAFPNTFGAAPVEWRTPLDHASAEFAFIVHSSRLSATQLGLIPELDKFLVWFPRWIPRLLREDLFHVTVPVAVAGLSIGIWIISRTASVKSRERAWVWLALVPISLTLVAWFSVAPEPRYVSAIFWSLAALCAVEAVRNQPSVTNGRWRRLLIACCVLLGLSPAIVMPVLSREGGDLLMAVATANANRTPVGAQTRIRVPPVEAFTTNSGLVLQVPVKTGGRCFDAPLLCTPNPAPNLRLRDPNNIEMGFAVDGAWQMKGWPADWFPNFLRAWRDLRDRNEAEVTRP